MLLSYKRQSALKCAFESSQTHKICHTCPLWWWLSGFRDMVTEFDKMAPQHHLQHNFRHCQQRLHLAGAAAHSWPGSFIAARGFKFILLLCTNLIQWGESFHMLPQREGTFSDGRWATSQQMAGSLCPHLRPGCRCCASLSEEPNTMCFVLHWSYGHLLCTMRNVCMHVWARLSSYLGLFH